MSGQMTELSRRILEKNVLLETMKCNHSPMSQIQKHEQELDRILFLYFNGIKFGKGQGSHDCGF